MPSRRQTLQALSAAAALGAWPDSMAAGSAGANKHAFHPFDFQKRTVRLNNGIDMPIIGIGVWTLSPEQAEKSVSEALKAGYRLIDTARMYRNEEAVGRAVRSSGIDRKDIFITTKIYGSGDYGNAEATINERLRLLGTDYIDLLLLHYPDRNDTQAWKVMEGFVKSSKIRAIGLSNYHQKTVSRIMEVASIPPAVVQNEVHIYNQDKHTKAYFRQYGTQMQAWYPLGGRDSYGQGGKNQLFADATIVGLAKKYGKSPAQVLLRWQLQAGNIAIPGSSNPAHIRENIDIFDFSLTEAEMAGIARLDKQAKFSTFGGE